MSSFRWSVDLQSTNAISRGPILPKETDRCIVEYETLRDRLDNDETAEALDAYKAFRSMIERRIEDLEDFYLKHDADNKAILFEKQRLRLRRLLHSDSGRSLPHVRRADDEKDRDEFDDTKISSIRHDFENQKLSDGQKVIFVRMRNGRKLEVRPAFDWHLIDLKKHIANTEKIPIEKQRYVYNNQFLKVYKLKGSQKDLDVKRMTEEFAALPDGAVLKLQRPSPKMAYSTNMSPRDKFASSIHRMRANDEGKNRNTKAIYDWEMDKDELRENPKYKLDANFTFQIKLNEKEFFKLTSRRRTIGAEQRHKARTASAKKTESPYFQGPYVDPMRITKHIYRS